MLLKEQIQKYLIWIKNTLLKCRLRHTNYLLKRKHYALWGGGGWRGWNLMIFPSTKTEARIGIKMIIAKYNYLDNIHNDIFGRWKMNCQAIGLLSKTHTQHLTFPIFRTIHISFCIIRANSNLLNTNRAWIFCICIFITISFSLWNTCCCYIYIS